MVVVGAFTIVGLAFVQFYLLKAAFDNRKAVFEHSVQVSLFKVVSRLNDNDLSQLPQASPVIKKSSDYYVVDVNRDFDCEVLEFYLKNEFEKAGIKYDFEYAIYDCHSDIMVYGNFVSLTKDAVPIVSSEFLKHEDFVYYFAVHFPTIDSDILGSLRVWFIFASVLIVVMFFIVYAIIVVLGQKRYSELQRTFVNTVSHEFRTPISASNVAIEYLQQNPLIQSDNRLEKYIELIHLQNTRLNSLIDRLLNLSKAESSIVELDFEKMDVQQTCLDVVAAFKAHNDKVQFEIGERVTETAVCADRFHAGNIFHVIIDNGMKYSLRGNASPVISIKFYRNTKYLIVAIADNGIGIPPKHRKKVFKQFYRVPTGNVHNVKGFGIGLYYAGLLAKKMKWTIKVEDSIDGGACFKIKIPFHNHRCNDKNQRK